MAGVPLTGSTGDPIARAQLAALGAVRRFGSGAADAGAKLTSGERIVNPGDDVLAFNVSRRIRSDVAALRTVAESGQMQAAGLGLAIEGLGQIKTQLDRIRAALVQAQAADEGERGLLQGQIDLALAQIDSTAQNSKLGSRSLLNGDSSVRAFANVAANGSITDFAQNQGAVVNANSGVQRVRVNQLGNGGPVRTLDDGRSVLSLNISILIGNEPQYAWGNLTGGGGADEWVEYRITGRLGSTVLRIQGNITTAAGNQAETVNAFNQLVEETGVVMSRNGPSNGTGDLMLQTIGTGENEFIRVEKLAASAGSTHSVSLQWASAVIGGGQSSVGAVARVSGRTGLASVNGELTEMGGQFGTTIHYNRDGYDLEIDLNQRGLTRGNTIWGANVRQTVNVLLSDGTVGILGLSGRASEAVSYGIASFTTAELGTGPALRTVTPTHTAASWDAANMLPAVDQQLGGRVLGRDAVAMMGSGGRLSLDSGNTLSAIRVLDRAVDQVLKEQARLGALQSAFVGAIGRAESQVGSLSAADADIIGVDAASEVSNLIQAQLGVSTGSAVLSQMNGINGNVLSLLRG